MAVIQIDPDRYIHAAMLKSFGKPLPKHIGSGIEDARKRAIGIRQPTQNLGSQTKRGERS